jgi:hypothetical protein
MRKSEVIGGLLVGWAQSYSHQGRMIHQAVFSPVPQ